MRQRALIRSLGTLLSNPRLRQYHTYLDEEMLLPDCANSIAMHFEWRARSSVAMERRARVSANPYAARACVPQERQGNANDAYAKKRCVARRSRPRVPFALAADTLRATALRQCGALTGSHPRRHIGTVGPEDFAVGGQRNDAPNARIGGHADSVQLRRADDA